MATSELSTRYVSPSEVDLDFSSHLQGIAQRAWTAGLEGVRDPDEVAQAFNPDNPALVAEAQKQYADFARLGSLVVVSAGVESPVLGFAMAKDDVSPYGRNPIDMAKRGFKRGMMYWDQHITAHVGLPYKVYAWEKHVAVEPDAPKGAGTLAVKASLNYFYPEQVSTAYIDDENEQSLGFFKGLGYKWDGESEKQVYRFGEHNDPTTQRRYIARVDTVRANASGRLDKLA